jgi:hypothetical protein
MASLPAVSGQARLVSVLAVGLVVAAMSLPAIARDPWDSSDPVKPKKTDPAKTPAKPAPDKDVEKSKPKPPTLAEEGREVFKPTPGSTDIAPENAWTIALVVFRGETAGELGRLALHKVQTQGSLPEAFIERRGESVMVAYGRFASADDERAIAEVKRVQEMVVQGQRPYKDALLTPPATGFNMGNMPQLNLLQAKAMYGDDAIYTLQVAVYGRRDLPNPTQEVLAETRRAAEQAAARYRQEGEQAFYYHGPRMSMVTVGVFNVEDFDPQTPSYKSTRLMETQKRHPYNLYNGAGIKELNKGGRLQPSNLVQIPEK